MRRIAIIGFGGAQLLDVTGPASVFACANDEADGPAYDVVIVSAEGGLFRASGVSLESVHCSSLSPDSVDTLLVAGGTEQGLRTTIRDEALREWTVATAARCRRFGSVCSGALVLAAWGLLDGRRVATHWSATAELARRFPALSVDAQALYVEDGRVWTSAGVTTGIDMSLALVERDLGAKVAASIARRLVLYARRPGTQSQFSPLLDAQAAADGAFAALIDWMHDHLAEPLDVETLAARAGQSVRSFHRKFTAATGSTPARFVEMLRLERARTLLGAGLPLKRIAADSGFGAPDQLTRAFTRTFGIAPSTYRELHASGSGAADAVRIAAE